MLDGVGAEAAVADEGLGGLVVDGGEGGEFGEELLEEGRGQRGHGGGDGGLVGEDDGFGDRQVAGEKAPVDVGPVADVGVVVLDGGGLEDALDEGLVLRGVFQEEFYDRGEDLELSLDCVKTSSLPRMWVSYLDIFVHEAFNESGENLIGIADFLGVFADDPD